MCHLCATESRLVNVRNMSWIPHLVFFHQSFDTTGALIHCDVSRKSANFRSRGVPLSLKSNGASHINVCYCFVSRSPQQRPALCMRIFFWLQSCFSARWIVYVDKLYLLANAARLHSLSVLLRCWYSKHACITRLCISESSMIRSDVCSVADVGAVGIMKIGRWYPRDDMTHCDCVGRRYVKS